MKLGMTNTEEFSELLKGVAEFYECDFNDLICEDLNISRQIEMLIMVFANSAENNLTWWTKLADKINETTVEEIEKLKVSEKMKLLQLKFLIKNLNGDSSFMTHYTKEMSEITPVSRRS